MNVRAIYNAVELSPYKNAVLGIFGIIRTLYIYCDYLDMMYSRVCSLAKRTHIEIFLNLPLV